MRVWSSMENRGGLWFQAAFVLLWGVLCLLAAFGVIWEKVSVPRWLLLACSGVFVLVALYMISMATGGDARRSPSEVFLHVWIGPIAILLLAVGVMWIGFGPGERLASAEGGGILGFFLGRRVAGAIETRIVFGGVGLAMSLLALVAFRSTWRYWQAKRPARDDP